MFSGKQKIKLLILALFLASILIAPFSLKAASLRARPLTTQVKSGSSFTVSVDVSPEGKAVNNVEGVITFPNDLVEATSVSTGGSIISLWVEPAAISNSSGTVSFNGGIPNPGFSGASGHVLSITFKAKAAGAATIGIASAAVRENDGLGTNILSGRSGGTITITGENQPTTPSPETPDTGNQALAPLVITSPTHPDSNAWSKNKTITFRWNLPAGATAIQTGLSKVKGTAPSILRRPALSSVTVTSQEEGQLYFAARYNTAKGWSRISVVKVMIDSTPPVDLKLNNDIGTPVVSANDESSGVDYFMVSIDGAEAVRLAAANNSAEINIPGITDGKHNLVITAVDRAGNSSELKTSALFSKKNEFKITFFTEKIKQGDSIRLKGVGPAGNTLAIHIKTEDGLERTYNTVVSSDGIFTFQSEALATTGTYTVWAETGSAGAQASLSSEKINIFVAKTLWGKVLGSAKQAAAFAWSQITPSNIIIVILSIIASLGWMSYFRLRRVLKFMGVPPRIIKRSRSRAVRSREE